MNANIANDLLPQCKQIWTARLTLNKFFSPKRTDPRWIHYPLLTNELLNRQMNDLPTAKACPLPLGGQNSSKAFKERNNNVIFGGSFNSQQILRDRLASPCLSAPHFLSPGLIYTYIYTEREAPVLRLYSLVREQFLYLAFSRSSQSPLTDSFVFRARDERFSPRRPANWGSRSYTSEEAERSVSILNRVCTGLVEFQTLWNKRVKLETGNA